MINFVHAAYPVQHSDVARVESAAPAVRQPSRGIESRKGLAALLLAAVVAALLVAANQMIDTWSDDHLLAAWVILWAIGFAALGLFAGTARKLASGAVARLDAWSYRVARARADARFLKAAQNDPRIMADLQAAVSRQRDDEVQDTHASNDVAVVPSAHRPGTGLVAHYESLARNIPVTHFASSW
ncbi:MAG: hypothetical protein P4L96_09950 [Rhodoferax sp.]|nr:hypothetical protein [Rhodoferax sp.]